MTSSATPPTPPAAPNAQAESLVLTLPDDPASQGDWYLWAGVLALLVFVVFYPAINGQILWDDDHHVGLITSVDSPALQDIWLDARTTPQYYPLTFTSYWLEHLIWKDNLLGYHLGNMLLHAGAAILVWRLLKRLGIGGAWVAAAIWAIHPLQAESVCWMSERKNVLSGLLFFASIWFYLEFAGLTPQRKKPWPGVSADGSTVLMGNRGAAYVLSLLLLILGLLAKSVVCAMPAVMLILLWWKKRKVLSARTIGPLVPFFAAGLAMSAITVYLETSASGNVKARGPDWDLSAVQRLLIAGRGWWFYIAKLLWPQGLAFSYPRILPTVQGLGAAIYAVQWVYALGVAAALAILWRWRDRLGRGPLAAALFYTACIFPALGFINIYPMRYSFVADHFQYLAGLGWIVLSIAAISQAIRRTTMSPGAAAAIATVLLASLGIPAWQQAHIYDDPIALWRDTITKNPDSWIASDNLGVALIRQGVQKQMDAQTDDAQNQPDTAADDTQAAKADFEEAENHFRHALQLRPSNYNTHNALGQLYRRIGRKQEAEVELRAAVEMDMQDDPMHQLAAPYINYASILHDNHPDLDIRPWLEKVFDLARLPRSKPLQLTMGQDVATAHMIEGNYWLNQAIAAKGRNADEELNDLKTASNELQQGLRVTPENITGLYDMARVYLRLGELDRQSADQARAAGRMNDADLYETKSLQNDDATAEQLFAAVLARIPSHRMAGAQEGRAEIYHHRAAVTRDAQIDLINTLLLSIKFSKDALQTDPQIPGAVQNLSVAYDQLLREAQTARAHAGTWPVLSQALAAMAAADFSKDSAAAADKAARQAMWPLALDDPLRPALQQFHLAVEASAAPTPAPQAAKNLRDSAANVQTLLSQRDASRQTVNDAILAALCYEGAVTANEHSSEAWLNLRAMTDALTRAVAAHSDAAGLQKALDQATFVLDQRRAATQPVPLVTP